VLGIACGVNAATGDTTGVAWGAEWIAAAAIGQPTGAEFDSDIIAAMEWLCDPDGDPGTIDDVPDVVVCAFGVEPALPGDPPYASCDARFQQVIDHLEAAGTVVVWSAGNNGPGRATIASPADLADGPGRNLAVGAVDATHSPFPYPVPEFSARGPSDCDSSATKPDIVAPGLSVRTTFPGATVGNFSGTSAAVPHIGGVVALLREVDPDLDVISAKEILLAATVDLAAPGPDNDSGHGLIDAMLAVELAIARVIAVEPQPTAPRLALAAPRPNPAAGAITVEARLAVPDQLILEVYSAHGRAVRRLDHGWRPAGRYQLAWDGRDERGRRVAGGVYFVRLAGAPHVARKLVVIR
jgi:bacillopeptidase F